LSAQQAHASNQPCKRLFPCPAPSVCISWKFSVVGRFKRWPKELLRLIKLQPRKFVLKYLLNHPGDFYSVPRQVIGLPNVGCPSACLKTNCFHANNKGHGNEEV
jgi:hypothetical protein